MSSMPWMNLGISIIYQKPKVEKVNQKPKIEMAYKTLKVEEVKVKPKLERVNKG